MLCAGIRLTSTKFSTVVKFSHRCLFYWTEVAKTSNGMIIIFGLSRGKKNPCTQLNIISSKDFARIITDFCDHCLYISCHVLFLERYVFFIRSNLAFFSYVGENSVDSYFETYLPAVLSKKQFSKKNWNS